MHVQSYLFFNGRTQEALDFYQEAAGAEIEMVMRFKDNPEPEHNPPGSEDKVMHAAFRIGHTQILASDGMCSGTPAAFAGVSLALTCDSVADAERLFEGLSAGGTIDMPMAETFFSPKFGALTDRFGVSWMVLVDQ